MKQLTLSLISDITSRINSTDDLEELLGIIIETTKDVLNTEGCSLLLYDSREDCLVFHVAKGAKGDSLAELKVPKGKGIAGAVLQTLKPLIVNDAENDPRIYRNIDETVGFVTKNLICVPMLAQGEIQGVLEAVNSLEADKFTTKDIRTLAYLSDLAAIAIRNRKLIQELKSRVNELNCLYQISQDLTSIVEMNQFLQSTVESVSSVLDAERASLIFRDPQTGQFQVSQSVGFSSNEEAFQIEEKEGIIGRVLKTGQPFFVQTKEDVSEELLTPDRYKTHSFISIPIKQAGEIIGILSVADKFNGQSFQELDLRILTTISQQIAEAYNNILIKEQTEKLAYIQRDLQIASQIQKYSLPTIPKKLSGLEIETAYIASKEIGGDFYDLVYHNPSEVSVLIADVSGKGVPAALFMEFSKTIISGEVNRNSSTGISLMSANRIIQENSGYFMFVTVMLVRINTEKKILRYSSAGHNEQFLYRTNSKTVEMLSAKGMPLGIKESEIAENEIHYEPGDLLILYTDGVTEAENIRGELYGMENFRDFIQREGELPIPELKEKILAESNRFRGSQDQSDDYTLMIVRLT